MLIPKNMTCISCSSCYWSKNKMFRPNRENAARAAECGIF